MASVLLSALKTGVFYWLLVNLSPLATAAFDTFLQWGIAPAGGVSAATFQAPSQIINLGFRAAGPIKLFIDRLAGWSAMWNFFTLAAYVAPWWIIVIAFACVALHLMITIIEYHMAVLAGAVLIPWERARPDRLLHRV